MTAAAPDLVDQEYLAEFFRSQEMDEFVAVPITAIQAPPGRRPSDLLPACRTVIIYGKVMGDDLFLGSVRDTMPRIAALKKDLVRIGNDLGDRLEGSGSAAVTVESVIVRDGKLKGSISLKHCARDAGLGEIGDNGLLISPRFGIRLGLGAVLTDREIPGAAARTDPVRMCTHCGLCVRACPEKAIDGNGIDTARCRNFSGSMPAPVVAIFVRLMGEKSLEPFLSGVANLVASKGGARCSECLTACPFFRKYCVRE